MAPAVNPRSIKLLPWSVETVRAIAVLHRRLRRAGELESRAWEAARVEMLRRHPELSPVDAGSATTEILAAVASEHRAWFYDLAEP